MLEGSSAVRNQPREADSRRKVIRDQRSAASHTQVDGVLYLLPQLLPLVFGSSWASFDHRTALPCLCLIP